MAFPVPSHLPRKKNQDVSTKLLSEISETTFKSLSQEVASKWVAELDVAIRQTKEEIHKRIHSELPAFNQQLSSSKYVQERLQALETNVDKLSTTLSHPETGLVPNLLSTLTQHAALAQELSDAEVMHQAMSHLAHCKREMQSLASLVEQGRLPDAIALCVGLERSLATAPPPLPSTDVVRDVQRRFRALKDRTEEQLNEAYSRGVGVTANEFVIRPSVRVRASDTELTLSEILTSLSPVSLTSLVNVLRRDFTAHYIDYLLSQPASVEQSSVKQLTGISELKLTIFPSPPNTEKLISRLENMSTTLNFLNDNLLHHFPSDTKLAISLTRPLTSGVLQKLLIPSLPSSARGLPMFLDLMKRAVEFEDQYIVGLLGGGNGEKEIKAWAEGIAGHYERKRRVELLERAREIVLRDNDETSSFKAEVNTVIQSPPPPTGLPVTQIDRTAPPEEEAWGFDGEEATDNEVSPAADEDGWGFDEDASEETPAAVEPEQTSKETVEDSGDAWGWNDGDKEEEAVNGDGDDDTDSSAWDDPWGDSTESTPDPTPASSTEPAKAASRLERLSNKSKSTKIGPPIQSPIPVAPPPPTPAMPSSMSKKQATEPIQPVSATQTESYLVSNGMKELFGLVEETIREAADLMSSGIFSSYATSGSQVGGTIGLTTVSILDLYRALYPVHAGAKLSNAAKWSLLFSNNCTWLGDEVARVAHGSHVPKATATKLVESAGRLKEVGELWYEDTVDGECQKAEEVLAEAQGFTGTTDQDRYDECEAAVNQVLQNIRRFSQQIKPVLSKSRYYQAVGTVIDVALSRILSDVLALSDITAEESQKLGELCRIMNSLEGLFVENPDLPSFVVDFVPSWFKFSYLSELLEASMVDISYLFEEGALVDFSIEELVNLVRALFADSPLRTNTINKLMQGHPPIQS
ncbi:Centromere/kinetochore Zw10-domain-containing protein [Irpex rosettiformis]|uniref:Centromere/kinetochore Zw10-domain-containing protein n=1 Tax=Irpex rosettiformis TaxID=378272 RepID=A0ACB8UAU2_9APHY|nr:Centromere/kinetochore Zw10-domain-containing protein [Irpex rosettiformis]